MEYKDENLKQENSAIERIVGHLLVSSKFMFNCKLCVSKKANDAWIGRKLVKYKMKQLLKG